jgi:rubrerythrin
MVDMALGEEKTMGRQQLHYENLAGMLIRKEGKLSWWCTVCHRKGESHIVLKKCPICKGKGRTR